MKFENSFKKYNNNQKNEMERVCSGYINFLNKGKTERECVKEIIKQAQAAGYKDIESVIKEGGKLSEGDKVYSVCMGKAVALFNIGEKPMTCGMNILGAHIDSPRLDIKQNPLFEDGELAFLDTHYYGGIKKYQWVALPLALHGVVVKKSGQIFEINIGEDDNDPVFCITDLLIHLAQEQMEKKGARVVEGEDLNILIGNSPAEGEEKDGFYTYIEAAHELADYVKEMGYTHVELMGIAEHPFDGSWGYQVTGYYAPTSRYGTPKDFMYFVNYLHKKGIGIILDWVPAHFPRDAHGLADFDGQPLYEYADPRKGEHPDWGTKVFDYGKNEVKNFLIANALFWVEKFHVDGLRVDAVASMLYLDYGRTPGNWVPNIYGGHENLEAIEFFKHLNSVLTGRKTGAVMIAEESTAWPKVTGAPEDDGLGFTFKWNMGWMHDFLEYMKLDPYFRKYNHNKMTFGLTYFTSENYILVLSHDEVVHLKCSMINKMPGIYEDKFANLKCAYTFMMGHPGKKLLFMGQDFGQWHEWDEKVSLDWYLTGEDLHASLQSYVKDLLHLYQKYPALYRLDNDWNGFQWVNANDGDRSIFSFIRRDETGKRSLLFVINFTPMERSDYRVGVPKRGVYSLILNSQEGLLKKSVPYRAKKGECDGQPYSVSYPLAPYGTAVFRF